MPETTVDIEFLAKQGHQILNELRSLRKEVSEVRTLTLHTIEYSRRVERRTSEMRDDLELMIKAELSGGLANMGTQLDNAMQPVQELVERLTELEEQVENIGRGPK